MDVSKQYLNKEAEFLPVNHGNFCVFCLWTFCDYLNIFW